MTSGERSEIISDPRIYFAGNEREGRGHLFKPLCELENKRTLGQVLKYLLVVHLVVLPRWVMSSNFELVQPGSETFVVHSD